jgi:DNA polymerase epsilon subunit 3
MPPRKSDISKAGTGDEATAAKEALVRDGINIEVHHLFSSSAASEAVGPSSFVRGRKQED